MATPNEENTAGHCKTVVDGWEEAVMQRTARNSELFVVMQKKARNSGPTY